MPVLNYQWFDVTANKFEIKFANNLDTTTLVNANFNVFTDADAHVADPFLDIDVARDYSPISRVLTLWWDTSLATGNYYINVTGLKNFLSTPLPDFSIEFNWAEAATPSDNGLVTIPPDRTPVEVEDYSIKEAGWTIVEDPLTDSDSAVDGPTITILDVAPPISSHHYLDPIANEGRIDLLFSSPIAMNYVNSSYFELSRKAVKKGMAQWETVPTAVVSDTSSTIISVYLPASEVFLESATPVYSFGLSDEEVATHEFFMEQYKYRLIISKAVGN